VTDAQPFRTCAFHPDRRAGVVCQRCDKPICPSCMHQASVGFHCPDCVRQGKQKVVRGNAAFGRNPGNTPLTFVLIAVNVAVFFYEMAQGDIRGTNFLQVVYDFGLNAFAISENGEWYRIVTSAFLHASIFHLLLNMYALFVLGPIVERTLGRVQFGIVYAAALMAGSAGALLLSPNEITVGASGAIYGLLGALVVIFRSRGISLMQSGLGITLLINFVFTLTISNISLGGHLGGLIGGGLAALVIVEGPQRIKDHRMIVWLAGALVPVFFVLAMVFAASGV
jgi:membrane associated rhomboid family serine protease